MSNCLYEGALLQHVLSLSFTCQVLDETSTSFHKTDCTVTKDVPHSHKQHASLDVQFQLPKLDLSTHRIMATSGGKMLLTVLKHNLQLPST